MTSATHNVLKQALAADRNHRASHQQLVASAEAPAAEAQRSLTHNSMDVEVPIDDDRTAWDAAWRDRPLRRLVIPVQIDVSPTLNDDWGEITQVDIAVDPAQYVSSGWRNDDICPVCGRTTTGESSRLAVTIYPYFSNGFSYGLGAWAHESCFALCEEVPGPAPVPW